MLLQVFFQQTPVISYVFFPLHTVDHSCQFVGFFLLDFPPGKAQKLDNKDLVHQHSESLILHCVNGCDM